MSARKMNEATDNSIINTIVVDTLWDKNADLSEDDSSIENSLNMFGKVMIVLIIIISCYELLIDTFDKSNPSCIVAVYNSMCYVNRHTSSCVKLLAVYNISF